MRVYIRDLLGYAEFKTAEIMAGASGLYNQIKRINLLGITTEEINNMQDVDLKDLVSEGDFYIALGSFFDRSDVDFYNEFKSLIHQESAGLCIIGYRSTCIDKRIKELCNEHGYPIITLEERVPFSNLIDVLMNSLIRSRLDQQVDRVISRILYSQCSDEVVENYMLELEPRLNNNIIILYMSFDNDTGLNSIRDYITSVNKNISVFQYKKSLFTICHSRTNNPKFLNQNVRSVIKEVERHRADSHIGVSCYYQQLHCVKEAMKQAMFASIHADINNDRVLYYGSNNIYNWIYELMNSDVFNKFVREILDPIKKYEQEHQIELIKTLECFIEYEGDFKKMATKLHLHQNTVRYRVDKIREIVNMEDKKISFYSNINIAIKYEHVRKIMEKINGVDN